MLVDAIGSQIATCSGAVSRPSSSAISRMAVMTVTKSPISTPSISVPRLWHAQVYLGRKGSVRHREVRRDIAHLGYGAEQDRGKQTHGRLNLLMRGDRARAFENAPQHPQAPF